MTYQEFIIKYPYVDLFIEIVKGIMPWLVALLAIYVNNEGARKRDIKNRENDYTFKIKNEMLERGIRLLFLYKKCGESVLQYVNCTNNNEINARKREFENCLFEFQYCSKTMFDYYNTLFIAFEDGDGNNFSDVLEIANEHSNFFIDMFEKYSSARMKIAIEFERDLDSLCEELKVDEKNFIDTFGFKLKKLANSMHSQVLV